MVDSYEDRLPEFPDLTAEQVRDGFRLNWWGHKFVRSGVTVFYVNHAAQLTGENARFPNDNVGASLAAVEAQIPSSPLGATDDSNWIIQRIGGTIASRSFNIHHNPNVRDKCPPSGSYASLQCIADNRCLTQMHNTNTNPPTCCAAAVCGE
jgi:hypothetical protein